MRPLSADLRWRIVEAIDQREGSLREIADRFRVSLTCIVRLLRRRRETGSIEPKPHGGGRLAALDEEHLQGLRELVCGQPDATLEELRQRLGVDCSVAAISRALKKLGITRKKKVLHAQQRDTPEVQKKRRAFCRDVAKIDPQRLVFVDESGVNTAMTRTHGRAPAGERVHGAIPGFWESVTLICGLRLSGVTAPLVFPGATDTPTFEGYVNEILAPQLRPGDVVIWDNLQPHKAESVIRAVESAHARVIHLPPSSPDLTPIEEMFSKAKEALRSIAARTTEAIYAAIGPILKGITLQNILGWFQSRAAYAMQT
jgi:transposase